MLVALAKDTADVLTLRKALLKLKTAAGDVGLLIKLTFYRDGLVKEIAVARIDAHLLAQHRQYDDYFAECARQIKYW